MNFKEFMTGVGYLPASIFSGLVNLVFGSTEKPKQDESELDNPVINRGLFGLILDLIKYLARTFSDFIANHKKAIAVAFWSSLALAGAAALTVFLWPAALTAVTTFSIYGISIASVVGANATFQIAAVAALAFITTSVTTYLAASVINTLSAIVGYWHNNEDTSSPSVHKPEHDEHDEEFTPSHKNMAGKLEGSTNNSNKDYLAEHNPGFFSPMFPPGGASEVVKDCARHQLPPSPVLPPL